MEMQFDTPALLIGVIRLVYNCLHSFWTTSVRHKAELSYL